MPYPYTKSNLTINDATWTSVVLPHQCDHIVVINPTALGGIILIRTDSATEEIASGGQKLIASGTSNRLTGHRFQKGTTPFQLKGASGVNGNCQLDFLADAR